MWHKFPAKLGNSHSKGGNKFHSTSLTNELHYLAIWVNSLNPGLKCFKYVDPTQSPITIHTHMLTNENFGWSYNLGTIHTKHCSSWHYSLITFFITSTFIIYTSAIFYFLLFNLIISTKVKNWRLMSNANIRSELSHMIVCWNAPQAWAQSWIRK